MRKAINENRTVQLALVGIMVLIGGLLLMSQMGGGSSGTAPETATAPSGDPAATTTTGMSAAAAGTAPATAPATTDPAATGAVAATPVSVAQPPPSVVAPKLPQSFVSAYEGGDTVVLLVLRRSAVEDRLVEPVVRGLGRVPGVTTFVVPVQKVARYAAVTQSVQLERVPALVTVRPQGVSEGAPQASVSYGFRNPRSIVQAVRDAQYEGPVSSYSPD